MITPSGRTFSFAIDDASMVGEARRTAMTLAARLGFDETERGKVAIATTEAATNLSKHARGGEVHIQGLEAAGVGGLDILSLDRGPGMTDVGRCLADGYSTAGSPGTGLGAMARLSSAFDLFSLPGTGTTTLSRLWAGPEPLRPAGLDFGAVNVPLAGEEVCGDSWAIEHVDGRIVILVVDGLGHGPQAAEAAREAVRIFGAASRLGPTGIVRAAHDGLRATRGAVLAICQLDPERGEARFAGVGNISGVIVGGRDGDSRTSMISHNGTVGHTVRKIQEFTYPWAPGSILVMHSDGIGTQWRLDRYSGLRSKHPQLIAGMLYHDFKRGRDDATVVVVGEEIENRP